MITLFLTIFNTNFNIFNTNLKIYKKLTSIYKLRITAKWKAILIIIIITPPINELINGIISTPLILI